uniref:Uncharacterized protein n=1 Tax=Glossina palpalis gambiensis TaxID=67801 RepID=A0A1B0AXU0_9MUSC
MCIYSCVCIRMHMRAFYTRIQKCTFPLTTPPLSPPSPPLSVSSHCYHIIMCSCIWFSTTPRLRCIVCLSRTLIYINIQHNNKQNIVVVCNACRLFRLVMATARVYESYFVFIFNVCRFICELLLVVSKLMLKHVAFGGPVGHLKGAFLSGMSFYNFNHRSEVALLR